MKSSILILGGVLTASVASFGWKGAELQEVVSPSGPPPGVDIHETNGASSLLGQFRTNTASWLWLRADLYLHNGVELRPLTDKEKAFGRTGVGSSDDLQGDESNVVTTIPAKEHDFRGIFGDLERAGSAYRLMKGHSHADPEKALPLFRLMTWADPQFVSAWQVGATIIARRRDAGANKQALEFLQQGLEHNPRSIVLHNEYARLSISRLQNYESALIALRKALQFGLDNFEKLQAPDREALQDTFRWLVLTLRDTRKFAEMSRIAKLGLKLYPEDGVLTRALQIRPSIFVRDVADLIKPILDFQKSSHDHDHDHGDHDHGHGDHDHDHGDHDHGH